MSNTLKYNAYQVLGLDLTANEKDILKRSKEILIRLKADEPKEYDFDIGLFDDFRNEDSVKEAVQKLQLPKKQIMEFFFWFYISDDTDKKALKYIKDKDYQSAIEIWGKDYKEDTVNSFNHKKNLALFLVYLLCIEDNEDCLEKSILLWKSVFDSEKYWSSFKKVYSLYNEQSFDDIKLAKLKTNAISYLGDIYTEFYEKYKNNIYIEKYQEAFSVNSNKIQNKILDPAFEKINDVVEELEKMKVSDDGVLDDEESKEIKKLIKIIQTELNNLVDVGLYEDSQTILMRDRAAIGLHTISIDIHNNLDNMDLAKKLLEVSLQICGTESLKVRFNQELNQIDKNIENNKETRISLEIPGFFSSSDIVFTDYQIEYQGKSLLYKDATSISWSSTRHSTNGIPTSQSYSFVVASDNDSINVSFSAAFRGGEKHNELFAKLVGISNNVIEPIVRKKLVSKIFDKKETVDIGSLHINDRGYYRNKFFGGVVEILWEDVAYIPDLNRGEATVYEKNNKGEASTFLSIPMSTHNAVLIPELIRECLIAKKYNGR